MWWTLNRRLDDDDHLHVHLPVESLFPEYPSARHFYVWAFFKQKEISLIIRLTIPILLTSFQEKNRDGERDGERFKNVTRNKSNVRFSLSSNSIENMYGFLNVYIGTIGSPSSSAVSIATSCDAVICSATAGIRAQMVMSNSMLSHPVVQVVNHRLSRVWWTLEYVQLTWKKEVDI